MSGLSTNFFVTRSHILSLLLALPSRSTFWQFFCYCIIGGTAAVVDFSTLFIATEYFGLHYLISTVIGFCIASIVHYLIAIFWVFTISRFKNKSLEISLYFIIGAVGLLFTEIIMWFFTETVGLYYMLSKCIAAMIVLFWNFLARKFILFPSHK